MRYFDCPHPHKWGHVLLALKPVCQREQGKVGIAVILMEEVQLLYLPLQMLSLPPALLPAENTDPLISPAGGRNTTRTLPLYICLVSGRWWWRLGLGHWEHGDCWEQRPSPDQGLLPHPDNFALRQLPT